MSHRATGGAVAAKMQSQRPPRKLVPSRTPAGKLAQRHDKRASPKAPRRAG